MHLQRNLAIAAILGLSVSGCSSVKESLGATKQSPDETAIATRAPLVVPATFTLKPPQPGTPRPQDADPAMQAQRILGGAPKDAPASQGEMELLSASGAAKADPNIRQELRAEVVQQTRRSKSYADTILFWRGSGSSQKGTPLDAAEEAKRLAREPQRPVAPVIEKADASASAPTEKEKKAAEKESSGGWFNWF
jgi:hypothetical protein